MESTVSSPRQQSGTLVKERVYYISWASTFAVGIGLASLAAGGIAVVVPSTWFLFSSAIGLFMSLNNEIRNAKQER
jgi:hypothetical protein